MAWKKIDDTALTSIADAIRAKTGTQDAYTPAQMAGAIASIQAGGVGTDDFKAVIERTATNITLPEDLTSIGAYAFCGCADLAITSLPSGVTSFGNYAFHNCTNLALTSLPSGVESFGNYAFQNCTNLALTSLPSGVKKIGSSAFKGCTGLTTITFHGQPSNITTSAFSDCTNLLTMNVPWAQGAVAGAPWGATNATINYNYTGG